jgi:hypothetical protein
VVVVVVATKLVAVAQVVIEVEQITFLPLHLQSQSAVVVQVQQHLAVVLEHKDHPQYLTQLPQQAVVSVLVMALT